MVPVYQDQLHDWFKDLGFKSIHWYEVGVTIDEVVDWVMKFEALRTRMPFPVDGAVIKLNFRPDWKNFPNATKSARWGYAYKYAPEEAETVLKGITVQVGRTGALAPVAELEPVEVSGSTIERATLHNFDEIEKLGVYPGCRVIIAKAGEVIPMCCKVVEFVYICPICKFKGTEKEQMEHHSDVRIKMD
jgi:DNA ligase (NAD+)